MYKEKEGFKFDWQRAFMEYGPKSGTTRHILHALCAHMNLKGFCYPSMETLSRETTYNRRYVSEHIHKAIREGWLKKGSRQYVDQRWRNYTYQAVIPKNIIKLVTEGNNVEKDVTLSAKACYPECKKVVTLGNTNNNRIKKNKDGGVKKPSCGGFSPPPNSNTNTCLENTNSPTSERVQANVPTLLDYDFQLQSSMSKYFYDIGGQKFNYLKLIFGRWKDEKVKAKCTCDDWVDAFKQYLDSDKKLNPDNYKGNKWWKPEGDLTVS